MLCLLCHCLLCQFFWRLLSINPIAIGDNEVKLQRVIKWNVISFKTSILTVNQARKLSYLIFNLYMSLYLFALLSYFVVLNCITHKNVYCILIIKKVDLLKKCIISREEEEEEERN